MPKKLTRLMSLLLCLVIFTGAVGCSGEKGASGQKVAVPEVQRAKAAVTHGKDREKTCSSQQCVPERVVVENNALGSILAAANANKPGTTENYASGTQAAIKEACSGNTPVSCETAMAAVGSALAWPLLPEMAATTSLIGASANAGVGLLINGEVNPNDVILGYWTGALTAGTGLWGTMAVNAGSGATSSYLKGDDPLKGGAISGVASGFGYGAAKLVEVPFDKLLNPMKPWKDWLWTDVGMGISKPLQLEPLPGVAGNIFGSGTTEVSNDQAGKWVKDHSESKK
ncbi:hypothetical protein [Enterobacter sp. JBIWA003]|uniref:hypothetical protein n=1 Tax=Enterobacter sp. JBIWA003 TaxID=2831890 RepID=UPI001CBE5737|nr:hypothetical protein [Enterobacter sp. JBIWA003]